MLPSQKKPNSESKNFNTIFCRSLNMPSKPFMRGRKPRNFFSIYFVKIVQSGRRKLKFVLASGIFILIFRWLIQQAWNSPIQPSTTLQRDYSLPPWASPHILQRFSSEQEKPREDETPDCQVPSLTPFHHSILSLVRETPDPLQCETSRYPLLFNSSVTPTPHLIPAKSAAEIGAEFKKCCVKEVFRTMSAGDDGVEFGDECLPLSFEGPTQVPAHWEFLVVACQRKCSSFSCILAKWMGVTVHLKTVAMDFHSFIPWINNTEVRESDSTTPPLNVMIILLDATSRMNFLRVMPEVEAFLRENMSALEFEAFNKVGDNTFPNAVALLTGQTVIGTGDKGLLLKCENFYLDECPFIWKEYEAAGYRTLFAEDDTSMTPFNMERNGFLEQPTHYYWRPMGLAMSSYVRHEIRSLSPMCFGPRPCYRVTLDYMTKMVEVMSRTGTPFFQFNNFGTLTHEFMNGGRLMTRDILSFLETMQRQGIWNRTALFLLSDHGSRLESIRSYYQGFVEDRLPMLYVALPPWFSRVYPEAYGNIQGNRKRLTTMFDIHRTLQDMLWVSQIEDTALKKRTNVTGRKAGGISLFLPLPLSRTCADAGIPDNYCVCNLKATQVSPDQKVVHTAVENAVSHINEQLKFTDAPCATLKLERVLHSEMLNFNSISSDAKHMYRIVLETQPGPAIFEIFVHVESVNKTFGNREVGGSARIGRTNLYKRDSWCAEHDPTIRPYCVCNSTATDSIPRTSNPNPSDSFNLQ